MKRNSIIFLLLFTTSVVVAQKSDYITNGDAAMDTFNYSAAKMWYEKGVFDLCDIHCIDKLTNIWILDNTQRSTMGRLMSKCLRCLEEKAKDYGDTISMNLLVLYYTDGIGTNKDPSRAESWKEKVEEKRPPSRVDVVERNRRPNPPRDREKSKMNFFVGYSATWEAPVGLTVGGIGKSIGWYLRFRSNLSSQKSSYECDETGKVPEMSNRFYKPSVFDNVKKNTVIGTGGIIINVAPSFYLSAGAGYCKSEILYKFEEINDSADAVIATFWAKYNGKKPGVVLDLDGTFKLGGVFYGSIGCSMLHLKDTSPDVHNLNISANAGIGVFF